MKNKTSSINAVIALTMLFSFVSCAVVRELTLTEQLDQAPPPPFNLTDWEQAFLANNLMPASPAPEYLTAPDGLKLAYRDWEPAGWDGTGVIVILVPGSTSHSAQYAALGKTLSDNGIFTRIIDVRGMGLSVRQSAQSDVNDFTPRTYVDDSVYYVGRVGDSFDENQIVRDLNLHIQALKTEFTNDKVFLCGHSSGCGVISRYVESSGNAAIAGTVLVGPFNHYDQPQNNHFSTNECYSILDMGALGDALRGNVHRYVIGFNLGDLPGLDLSVVQYTYNTMIGSSASDPTLFLYAYSRPVLWIHGEKDELFDPAISRQQFDYIPDGESKNQFVVLSNTSHIGLSWSEEAGSVISGWITNI